MGTALEVAVVVLMYAMSFALFGAYVAGSIGLVRSTSRTARRHGLPRAFRAVAVAVVVAVALVGGGFVFAFCWPFWQLRKTRPVGLRRRLLYVAAALSVLVPSGCAAASTQGPCFFDPPPGDQSSLTITNDTSAAVTVVDCLDETCAEAQSPTPVAAGRRASMPLEGCAGGTMGVLGGGTSVLRSCIPEPTEDDNFDLRPVAISGARPCPHARTGARIHIADPGS